VPHASLADPAKQLAPEQQPPGHDWPSQMQTPPTQRWPELHAGLTPHMQAPLLQVSDLESQVVDPQLMPASVIPPSTLTSETSCTATLTS